MKSDGGEQRWVSMVATVERLTDEALLAGLRVTAEDWRSATVAMLVHLGEVDARKLYRGEACSSMFVYCVERMHMGVEVAYRRIHAARAARRFPQILTMLAAGEIMAGHWDLPAAIKLVTKTPAEIVGLHDRGAIDCGRRADLVRVRHQDDVPVIRSVWRQGARVI